MWSQRASAECSQRRLVDFALNLLVISSFFSNPLTPSFLFFFSSLSLSDCADWLDVKSLEDIFGVNEGHADSERFCISSL